MWRTLSENSQSKRTEILHNIDDISNTASLTIGDWKIVKGLYSILKYNFNKHIIMYFTGSTYGDDWNHWYGPSGEDENYNISLILHSKTANAIKNISTLTSDIIDSIRYALIFTFTIRCLRLIRFQE